MNKSLMILLTLLLLAGAAFAYRTVNCPIDEYASCYYTGQNETVNGHFMEKYHCSCGHDVWVKAY